jgi:putative redox protein
MAVKEAFDDATRDLKRVELEVVVPDSFPEKYRVAILRAAEGCKVKKALTSPPEITVKAKIEKAKTAA